MKSIRLFLLVLGLVAVGVAAAPNAVASGAQAPTTAPVQPSTTLPKSTAIDPGYALTGAVITSASDPTPRTLNDYQAAVFVQSFVGEAVYGKPEFRDPPAGVPVYRVDVGELRGDGTSPPQPMTGTVYYASDGTNAFLSLPKGRDPANPTEPPPPASGTWWIAPQRTMDAFNGKGTLVVTAGVQQANSPRTPVKPDDSSSSSSSTSWVVYALGIAAAIVIIGGGVMFFRRRRRSPDDLAAAG